MTDRVGVDRRAARRAVAVGVAALIAASGLVGAGATRAGASGTRATAQAPGQLTVDDQARPLDVTGAPQFGWIPRDRAGNQVQTAYQIVVRNALTGVHVWDSGKVASSQSTYVPGPGPELTGGAEYSWTVVTWNRQGKRSPAAGSVFGMGLSDRQWSGAQWPARASPPGIRSRSTRPPTDTAPGTRRATRSPASAAAPSAWPPRCARATRPACGSRAPARARTRSTRSRPT